MEWVTLSLNFLEKKEKRFFNIFFIDLRGIDYKGFAFLNKNI